MGTAKRERQKANRQLKLEELHKEEHGRKTKRRVLQIGIIVPLLIVAVFGGVWLLGDNGDDTNESATVPTISLTETSVAADTTTAPSTVPPTTIPPLPCPEEHGMAVPETEFPSPPPMCIDITKVYEAEVVTNKGTFTIELDPGVAPITVNNFIYLARYSFFKATDCHRIIPDFVVQCGDPTGTGHGGPGYTFEDELPAAGAYQLGSVAMANTGPDSNGSQFFIVSGDKGTKLPPNYSLFGKVTDGFDTTVAAMAATGTSGGTPSEVVTIESVTISVKEGAVATPTTTSTTSTIAPSTTAAGETTTTAAG